MAVPSSGELELTGDIHNEVNGSPTGTNVSLRALSAAIGGTSPDAMSEFYGYASATAPVVSTSSSSGITNVAMNARGNVSSDGGATITERGVYFGTSTNRASNPKYSTTGTTGSFSIPRSGLSENTTYYVWAYATNSVGTTYGSMVTSTTYPNLTYTWNTPPGNYVYGMSTGWRMDYPQNDGITVRTWGSCVFYHPYLGAITQSSYDAGYHDYSSYTNSSWQYASWSGGVRGDYRTRVRSDFNFTGIGYTTDSADGYQGSNQDGAIYWFKGGSPDNFNPGNGFAQTTSHSTWYINHTTGGAYSVSNDPGGQNTMQFWVYTPNITPVSRMHNGYGYMDIYK